MEKINEPAHFVKYVATVKSLWFYCQQKERLGCILRRQEGEQFCKLLIFFFYCLLPSQPSAFGPKAQTVFTMQTNQIPVQCDPDRDHRIWSDSILVHCCKAPFTPAILVSD